jgi:hypothetical protein
MWHHADWLINNNVSEEPASIFMVEDRGNKFLQSTGIDLPDYMVSQARRH